VKTRIAEVESKLYLVVKFYRTKTTFMKKFFILITLIGIHPALNSQIVKYINLANGTDKISEPIESDKDIQIKILNRCKKNTYDIQINRISPDIPPLKVEENKSLLRNGEECDKLQKKIAEILNVVEEASLPKLRQELNELINKTSSDCPVRKDAIELDKDMDITLYVKPLKKGETLQVIIKKIGTQKEWTATFNTGSKGVWRTSYGFAMVSNAFSKAGKYYLDDSNRITKENNRTKIEFIPGIFFNWFPSSRALNSFSYGLSGGVGVNFNVEPVLFLGGSATYNHNISINIGLIGYNQSFLKGRYKEGEIINENNFDEESGLHQRLFRINPFVGISFRFGENPFKTPSDD